MWSIKFLICKIIITVTVVYIIIVPVSIIWHYSWASDNIYTDYFYCYWFTILSLWTQLCSLKDGIEIIMSRWSDQYNCLDRWEWFQTGRTKSSTGSVFYSSRLKTVFYWKGNWLLPSKVLKLAKLLLILPGTFSAMKHIGPFLRNTTVRNRLNHHIILNVHCGMTNQPNVVEFARDFKVGNQARSQVFRRF